MNFTCLIGSENEKRFVRDDLRAAMAESGIYTHRDWTASEQPSESDLLDLLGKTDVLLTGWGSPILPLSLLAQPRRNLRYICNLTGALKPMIPREYLAAGILATNWGDGPMWYLAEGNLALMLACSREMSRIRAFMQSRTKRTFPYRTSRPTLRRKTVGFLGFGAIARVLRGLLAPMEVSSLIYDPYLSEIPPDCARALSLEELFSKADVLTIQCGLTKETTGLVNRGLLDLLKPGAILVNTARGKIVIEKDLIAFLQARPDVFAGLDVYEVEPLPTDSPLNALDNAICYPHSVAGGGDEVYCAASEFAAANIRAFASGRPLKAMISAEQYDRTT